MKPPPHRQDEATVIYATATDPADLALGPLDWQVQVREFIWQAAFCHSSGLPSLGDNAH
jgi:hypothetical protein